MSIQHEVLPFATTLEVRDRCLCLSAQRAARALARRFDAAFRPLDITNGQFSLMMALNRPAPPALGVVADFLAMDRTTLTAALKPLIRRGLVTRETHPRDKRTRLLRLTEAGRHLLAHAAPIWRREHDRLDAELSTLTSGDSDTHSGTNAVPLRAGLAALAMPAATARDINSSERSG